MSGKVRIAALVMLALSGLALGDGSSSPLFGGYFEDSQCSTAYATAASSHELQTLAAAVKAAGLDSTLDDSSAAITVFAPTDDAFAALADALDLTSAELLAKSDLLKVILEYHVFAGDAYEESDFDDHDTLHMVEGESVKVDSVGDIYTVEAAAGSTATILVADLSACKAYVHIIDTVLIPKAAATAVGMTSTDVPGAGVTESEKATSVVSKKTTATPMATAVPVVLVPAATPVATAVPVVQVPAATPATTTPAVAVSGARATPVATSSTSGLDVPALTPIQLAPAATEATPPVVVSGARVTPVAAIPAATPAVVLTPVVAATPKATKAMTKPLLSTLLGSHTEFAETPKAHPVVTIVEATPEATPAATKAADHAVLNSILADKKATPVPTAVAKVIPEATAAVTKAAEHPVLDTIYMKATPVPTPAVVLVPVSTPVTTPLATPVATPEETVPVVAVSGARNVATATPVASGGVPATSASPAFPIVAAVAPAVANVEAVVGEARTQRREAVAPAAAAVAQAATTVRDGRAARLGLATPAATVAPAVLALDGPAVMVPKMAPESAPEMEMAPETAPGMAGAPAVMAEQGPTMMVMMTPAMAPGMMLPMAPAALPM